MCVSEVGGEACSGGESGLCGLLPASSVDFSSTRYKGHRYLVCRLFGDFNISDSIIKVTKVSIIGDT